MEVTDITAADLKDDILSPNFIYENRKQVSKRMQIDQCMRTLAIYTSSKIQDFESFLRTEFDLVEDDIRLVLEENSSSFFYS